MTLVESLPSLRPSTKRALQEAGFLYLEQLGQPLSPLELSQRCPRLAHTEIALVLEIVEREIGLTKSRPDEGKSAYELWKSLEETPFVALPTFSQELDDLLGGGIPIGELTEVAGPPGAGKTQLCHQLSVAVQLPIPFGGVGGKSLFVDTEGSFVAARYREVVQAAANQIHRILLQQSAQGAAIDPALKAAGERFTVESALESTFFYRIYTLAELVAFINLLDDILQSDPTIRLVIIDSIAFHFRYAVSDSTVRSRLLFQVSHMLSSVARTRQVAILVTNQMTSKMMDGVMREIPALGDAWAHGISNRIVIQPAASESTSEGQGVRSARLEKSYRCPKGFARFRITEKGVRNVIR
jgi:RAD51-like protein 2